MNAPIPPPTAPAHYRVCRGCPHCDCLPQDIRKFLAALRVTP